MTAHPDECGWCGYPTFHRDGHADFCSVMQAEADRFWFLVRANVRVPSHTFVTEEAFNAALDADPLCRHRNQRGLCPACETSAAQRRARNRSRAAA